MPTRNLARAAFTPLLLLLSCASAWSWGASGHQAVGAIADQLIAGTPTATRVRKTLGSTLQTAANWADCARAVASDKQGQWSYTGAGTWKACAIYENPASQQALIAFVQRNASRCGGFTGNALCRHKAYHFVDQSIAHSHYESGRPGTAPEDLVHATEACIAVLQGRKSPAPFDIRGPREALRLLVHYIGDLHQPLHVGALYLDPEGRRLDPASAQAAKASDNAGGNQILFDGKKLHAVWDDIPDKLYTRLMHGAGASAARTLPATPGPMDEWPAEWASDSIAQAARALQPLRFAPMNGTGSNAIWPAYASEPAYRQLREAMQEQQLVAAGARLAELLRTLFP